MSERCKAIDKELSRNGSGYFDPTAYKAMKRVEADERKYGRDYERFYNLLNTIFYICNLAGFHVEGRIVYGIMVFVCIFEMFETRDPLYAVAAGIFGVALEICCKKDGDEK